MFLNIQIDLIILKTGNKQFTLTTKKSLHITLKAFQLQMMWSLLGTTDDISWTVLSDRGWSS